MTVSFIIRIMNSTSPALNAYVCYEVKKIERILANQIRVFLIFKIKFKYVLIYVENSEKVHLT